jgi:hypothetical protein
LIREIEEIDDLDEKIRIQLSRKDRTNDLIRINRSTLNKSLNNLDGYFNNNSKKQNLSPSVEMNRSRPYN